MSLGASVLQRLRPRVPLARRHSLAIVMLGSGIALCVATYGVAEALLLRPPPFADPASLLWIGVQSSRDASLGMPMSQYETAVLDAPGLADVAPYVIASGSLTTPDGPQRLSLARVGARYFAVLGARPTLGRLLEEADDRRGAERVVVVSDSLWRAHLGDDPTKLGGLLELDGLPHRIIGVVAGDATYPVGTHAWVSLEATMGTLLRTSDVPFVRAIGRARDAGHGTLLTVRNALATRWRAPAGIAADARLVVEPLTEHLVKGRRSAVLLLGAASAFLMAIAVLGAVTLQLAALADRERDIAIRSALGASRRQLGRALLREAVAVTGAATLLGLVLSVMLVRTSQGAAAGAVPELLQIRFSPRVIAASLVFAAGAASLMTLVPMLALLRADVGHLLRRASQTTSTGVEGVRVRDALIAASAGISVIMVLGAITSLSTLLRLERIDMGFSTAGLAAATVRLPMQVVTPVESERIRAFVRTFGSALEAADPDVRVAVSTDMPGRGNQSVISVRVPGAAADDRQVGMSQVSGSFFELLGLRPTAGRTFESHDRAGGARVVIVDESLGRTLAGGGNVVGSLLEIPDLGVTAEVIGVVPAVWQAGRFGERLPQVYLPFDQLPLSRLTLLVRSGQPAAARVTPAVFQRVLRDTDPAATATRLQPLEAELGDELRRPRFYATTLAIIAALAIVVAAGAVHASVTAVVARRTREIGIRIALGASRGQVFGLVVSRVGAVILAGTVAGSVTAVALTGLATSRIAMDRPTLLLFMLSNSLVWVAAGLAIVRPVARATRISPVLALSE